MLNASGARYRVIIISACYSGVFARALADRRTLVITAAAPDRPSFGCEDGATWTYFGDAFFNQALRGSRTLDARDYETTHERAVLGDGRRLAELALRAEGPSQRAASHRVQPLHSASVRPFRLMTWRARPRRAGAAT
jgi:hypothetical protein